jgi:hypothetical protein
LNTELASLGRGNAEASRAPIDLSDSNSDTVIELSSSPEMIEQTL